MGWERWPKIVGEALSRLQSKGTWVDYVRSLVTRYQLQTCWEDEGWDEKVWKKAVVEQVEKEGKRAWREEVEGRQDLGDYKDRKLVLERAVSSLPFLKDRTGFVTISAKSLQSRLPDNHLTQLHRSRAKTTLNWIDR